MAELVDAHDSKSCFARSESSILSSPTKKIMQLKEINSLVELFFKKFEQISSESFEKKNKTFLVSLKEKNNTKKIVFIFLGRYKL